MKKPRVLILITLQFSVRILVRAGFIKRISEYVQPVVILGWDDAELRTELEEMGSEVYLLPVAEYNAGHRHLRNKINYLWNRRFMKSFSKVFDERIEDAIKSRPLSQRMIRRVVRSYYLLRFAMPGCYARLIEDEGNAFLDNPVTREIDSLLDRIKPDAVLCQTPYNRNEEALLRIAKLRGIPLCAAILSFDNVTAYGRIPVIFDWYLLWNKNNRNELLRGYPEASISRIEIIGAPQFDFYWNHNYLWEEKEWRRKLGLPLERPVILFGAGYYKIVPHEQHWLEQLDDAIESGDIRGKPVILFRIHPVDPVERWQPVLKRAKHIVFDEPWKTPDACKGTTNIKRSDIEKLASTLYHSRVHVNASSSMTVDGAIFDHPQVGPAYDDRLGRKYDRLSRQLYEREHFIPIVQSGGLEIVYSKGEMISAINSALENPGRLSEQRKKLVREVCTYTDGKSTDRLEKAFCSFLMNHNLF